jgi:hypothetical protein
MYQIKGFYNVGPQVDNSPDTVAMFGELSATARTYAQDLREYYSPLTPSVKFTLFSSKENNEYKEISNSNRDLILNIGGWLYDLNEAITANTTRANLANMLLNNYNNIYEVNVGTINYDTFRRLPDWISFKIRDQPTETEVKVWLANDAFLEEYDEYDIKIIPPFVNIDQFFMPTGDLKIIQNNISQVETMDRINEAKGDYPYTLLRAENTVYINPTNNAETLNFYWHAIIYGKAGDDSEIIRQAIINYINENSRSSENEWKTIIPDLFSSTLFFILPRWDKDAIPDRRTIPGIYSPISNHGEILEFTNGMLSSLMTTNHIKENLEITVHRYKSITLAVVGGEDNRRGLFKLTDYFGDYISEESTHEDFNRQKEATKKWTNMVTELLLKAENYEENPQLPSNTRMVTRGGKNYLVRQFDNIEYYLALKSSVV